MFREKVLYIKQKIVATILATKLSSRADVQWLLKKERLRDVAVTFCSPAQLLLLSDSPGTKIAKKLSRNNVFSVCGKVSSHDTVQQIIRVHWARSITGAMLLSNEHMRGISRCKMQLYCTSPMHGIIVISSHIYSLSVPSVEYTVDSRLCRL